MTTIKEIQLITIPAIAKPLGLLHTPMIEKTSPRTHKTKPNTGTQQNNNPKIAKEKPAIPMPFSFGVATI